MVKFSIKFSPYEKGNKIPVIRREHLSGWRRKLFVLTIISDPRFYRKLRDVKSCFVQPLSLSLILLKTLFIIISKDWTGKYSPEKCLLASVELSCANPLHKHWLPYEGSRWFVENDKRLGHCTIFKRRYQLSILSIKSLGN